MIVYEMLLKYGLALAEIMARLTLVIGPKRCINSMTYRGHVVQWV